MSTADRASEVGKNAAKKGFDTLNHYVQQGPSGVSVLCFFGSLATLVIGTMEVIENFLSSNVILEPFSCVLSLYVAFFGLTGALLECDAEKLNEMPVIGPLAIHLYQWQKFVFEYAKFLTRLPGRGGFYIFIGTLCIVDCILCPFFFIGAFNAFLGVLCIMMSMGMQPDVSYDRVAQGVETVVKSRALGNASGNV